MQSLLCRPRLPPFGPCDADDKNDDHGDADNDEDDRNVVDHDEDHNDDDANNNDNGVQ